MSQVGAVVCWLVLQICCAAYLQQQFQHRAQVLSTSVKRSVKTVHKWREDLYVTGQYTSCFPTQTCTNRTCTWNTCPGIQVGLGSSFRSSKPLRTKFPAQVPGRKAPQRGCQKIRFDVKTILKKGLRFVVSPSHHVSPSPNSTFLDTLYK